MRIEKFMSDGSDRRSRAGSSYYRLSCDEEWVADFAKLSDAHSKMEQIAMYGWD